MYYLYIISIMFHEEKWHIIQMYNCMLIVYRYASIQVEQVALMPKTVHDFFFSKSAFLGQNVM